MNEISAEELAAVAAALNVVMQSEERPVGATSAWKLAARQESVMTLDDSPFDKLRVTKRVV